MAGVRLVDGDDQCYGTPEILHDGQWESASSKTFDIRAAMVVCRELDCGNAVKVDARSQARTRARTETGVMLDCTGQESSVSQCIKERVNIDFDLLNIRTAVVCSDSVRLVDGAGLCSGRVEVKYHQSWTTVCEADFDWKDAEVVCRELGCGRPLTLQGALFGEGEHPFGTKEFQCKGTENRLLTCRTSNREENTCTRGKPVGLTCSGPDDVKLVDGSGHCAGTVEMFHSGKWSRVRTEMWSLRDAAVVCRQLDCGSAVAAEQTEVLTNDTEWSVLTACEGSEPALRECSIFVFVPAKIVATVTCSDSVRLVDGAGLCSGRVEVKSHQSWTRVCEADFDWQDAEVVCRELNCGTLLTLQGALFGDRKLPFGTKEFQCKGTENRLLTCRTSAREKHACTRGKAAGLTCSEPHEVRLVGGSSRCDGTVEVFLSGKWRNVTGLRWEKTEATVVCRQLDCGSAVVATIGLKATNKTAQVAWIKCKQSESLLRECTVLRVSSVGFDAEVTCSGVLVQPTISLSTFMRVSRGLQRSEVFRGHSFTITCSTQPQYPGGSFHLKLPWNNRSHTQTAVNHSASFLFPAADDSHQGNYSCVYENEVNLMQTQLLDEWAMYSSMITHNFSSESDHLSITVNDSPLPAIITRILLVSLLTSVTYSSIFLIFKKCGHFFIRRTSEGQF
ncbi:scavenger receptor cysteine-rich type 1 protein M130-like isoform X2 [Pygocentrus nattereri]|nr:scavenger receptor cysteine-rich type 1 protein M130-like isoform X2 [Pygocentrus nattereri]